MACCFGEMTFGRRVVSILTPVSVSAMGTTSMSNRCHPDGESWRKWCSRLAGAGNSSLQRLVQSSFGFLVIGARNLALLALDFQLEQLFFERLEQKRRTVLGRKNSLRSCTVRGCGGRRARNGRRFGRSCA